MQEIHILTVKVASRDDMFEVQLRIIQEIRQNPLIYDKAHRNHFKTNMRRNISNEIAILVNQEFNKEIDGEYNCNLFNFSFGINRKVSTEILWYMYEMLSGTVLIGIMAM